jgi:hypothetical protein
MLLPLLLSLLQHPVPTLDGSITPGEWDHAIHRYGSDQLEIWIADYADSPDSALYVAVRGPGNGFPHIGISRGDTVLILHASAALGTAVFVGQGELKHRVGEFNFRVRGTELGDAAAAERERFYREEGWVASTIRMGQAGETEFKISNRLLSASPRIAVAYWAESEGVSHWPVRVADAIAEERMVQGFLPEEARFRPGEWEAVGP